MATAVALPQSEWCAQPYSLPETSAKSPLVLLDPGHGMGNKAPGVYDPGIIGVADTKEAELALDYALTLAQKIHDVSNGGVRVGLTRKDQTAPCSLGDRVRMAKRQQVDLLLSLHFNGDGNEGNSAADGKAKGCEVIYRRMPGDAAADRSLVFANRCALALGQFIRPRNPAVFSRDNLYVLRYQPSILVEFGFLDDPEDAALLLDRDWQSRALGALARAVVSLL